MIYRHYFHLDPALLQTVFLLKINKSFFPIGHGWVRWKFRIFFFFLQIRYKGRPRWWISLCAGTGDVLDRDIDFVT